MKRLFLLLLPFLLISMSNCLDTDKTPFVVIMCDVTRSTNSSELNIISEKAGDLLKSLPENAQYAVYPVEKNFYSQPLLEHTEGFGNIPPSAIDAEKIKLADSLKLRIRTYYSNNNVQSSCILNSFESAFNKFPSGENAKKYNCHLVYFSDMLEKCDNRNIEVASMLEDSKKALEKMPKPTFSFAGKNISLDIVVVASSLPISHTDLQQFWSIALQKIGFQTGSYKMDTPLPQTSSW